MTAAKWTKRQVEELAAVYPEKWIELNGNTTKVAVELGLGETPASARGVLANLIRHHPEMELAQEVAYALLTDKFREVAIGIGLGEMQIRNNYPGMKWLEANESARWNPKQQVEVSEGGFSAGELKEEAASRRKVDGEVASQLSVVLGGGKKQ